MFCLLFILLFPALPLCLQPSHVKFYAFLFLFIKALLFIFKVLPSEADGSKCVSPLSLASGHARRPCRHPGREAQDLDAPSSGTSAGLPVLVLFIWFSTPVCMSEIPWSKQEGGGRPWHREKITQTWSSLCFWNKNCTLLSGPEIPLSRAPGEERRNGEFHRLPNALFQPKGVLQSFLGSQVICGKRRDAYLGGGGSQTQKVQPSSCVWIMN